MTTTKPLYILIKLDVDGEIVSDNDLANTYATNFCNSLEFQYIDHCLEDKDNPYLYIGGEEDLKQFIDPSQDDESLLHIT